MNLIAALSYPKVSIAGVEIIDIPDFVELISRFALNTIVIVVLVRWLYFSATRRKDYLFTFILIASIVFLLCFLLESVKLQIGFALGLFAIFGIIRYRTDAIPIKEMTYLFIVIGISVINALTSAKSSLADLLFTNLVIIFIAFGLEKLWLLNHEAHWTINYEKIDLIKPDRREELIHDLVERTGIARINRIEIGKIDFLKDTCLLTMYYDSKEAWGTDRSNDENNDDDDD